jgi:hypothetical protein
MTEKWIAVMNAEDGTISAAGPFSNAVQAEGFAAQMELATTGSLSGAAVRLETPSAFREEAGA